LNSDGNGDAYEFYSFAVSDSVALDYIKVPYTSYLTYDEENDRNSNHEFYGNEFFYFLLDGKDYEYTENAWPFNYQVKCDDDW